MRFKHTIPAFIAVLTCQAWAGFTNSVYLDESYDPTVPLQDGTVYVVTNSVEFTGAYDGKSGLAVAPGAEVVIFVQEGCRLYARGNDGDTGGAGGTAGKSGTGGKLYKSPAASFDGSVAGDNIVETSVAPAALGYRINFNAGEAMYKDVVLGVALGFAAAEVPGKFGKTFQGWYSGTGGTGVKWFNADGSYANVPEIYETVGDTELYAKWSDIQNFNPEDYRLDAAGIEVGSGFITIPVAIQNPANLDYALDFVKVYASESLPVQKNNPVPDQYLSVETIDGRKVLVIWREIAANSIFYLIDVGD